MNSAHHVRRQLLQRAGHRYRFDRVDRKMNPAAVAGASFGAGNPVPVPLEDPATAPIDVGDQGSIISERLHCTSD